MTPTGPPQAPPPHAFIPRSEAVKILGVSPRTMRRLIKRQCLRVNEHGRRRDVSREDVEALLHLRSTPRGIAPSEVNFSMLLMEARFQHELIDDALELLELQRSRLDLSRAQLLERHRAAVNALAASSVDTLAGDWLPFLVRLDISHIKGLAASGIDHPWVAFLRIAERLDAGDGFEHWRLARAARRNVEALAGGWMIERAGGIRAFPLTRSSG